MKIQDANQVDFSSIFFDSLFGLVLFFSLDSFLEIKNFYHFVFYLFTVIILVHWWLQFKSADDVFGEEVTDSVVDLVFGIAYVVLIEFIILSSKISNFGDATIFLIALLSVDFLWAFIWRFVGKWHTVKKEKVKMMEKELNNTMAIDAVGIILFVALLISVKSLTLQQYVVLFLLNYILFGILSFKTKVLDLRIF